MIAQNDRVIAKMANMPEKTTGGIYLPQQKFEDGKAKINIGIVLSAGPGMTLRTGEYVPVNVKKDDVIVWEQFGGLQFEILGPRTICIRAEDIGAVLDKSEYDLGWFDDYEEGTSPDEIKQKAIDDFKTEERKSESKNVSGCDCELLCNECGNKMDIVLKWKDAFTVDDSNLPACDNCKKPAMKVSKKNVTLQVNTESMRLTSKR